MKYNGSILNLRRKNKSWCVTIHPWRCYSDIIASKKKVLRKVICLKAIQLVSNRTLQLLTLSNARSLRKRGLECHVRRDGY